MNAAPRLVVYLLLCLIVSSCASVAIKGRVDGGKYYSPLDNFSVPLRNAMGLKIQDQNDAEGGRVSFPDDWGYLEAITYLRLPADYSAVLADSGKRDAAYRIFVGDYAMQTLFRRASEQSAIVKDEFLDVGGSRAYFAIVNIPGASAMVDPKTNKRLDSLRGLLVFDKNGFMYMLESEMNYAVSRAAASSLSTAQVDRTQATLRKIKDSMIFK